MSRNVNYSLTVRAVIVGGADELLALLEETADAVWLSRTVRARRHTLRGVPARRIDVVVASPADDPHAAQTPIVEIGVKVGKYDGATRERMALRFLPDHQATALPIARLLIEEDGADVRLSVTSLAGEILWQRQETRMTSLLTTDGLARIAQWHATRYYPHLPADEARQVTDLFAAWATAEAAARAEEGRPPLTLAEANRAASRLLYQSSRRDGWCKLTLRERVSLGYSPEVGQWRRADEVGERRAARRGFPATGISEATWTASRTGAWPAGDDDYEIVSVSRSREA